MSDEAAFLRSICESPEDDAPRLVYADWLDDHGRHDRAEFIRLQCGYAARSERQDTKRLRRSRRLFAPHGSAPPGLPEWGDDIDPTVAGSHKFCRGFIAEVSCTLADWYGELCKGCYANDGLPSGAGHANFRKSECPVCCGVGRVNAHGPAVVAQHPVERVVLTDRVPDHNRWDSTAVGQCGVPAEIFAHLKDGEPATRRPESLRYYPTADAALADLYAAALDWARVKAGQRPLRKETA